MIAGMFSRSADPDDSAPLLRSFNEGRLFRYFPCDSSGSWSEGPFTLVQQARHNSPQSRHECGIVQGDGLAVAAWATLHNREELFKELNIPPEKQQAMSDNGLILAGWRQRGKDCLPLLIGDYVFAVADTKSGQLFCARDPLGIRPLHYLPDRERFLFAVSMDCFKELPGYSLSPSLRWMADFMTGLSMSWTDTPYPELRRLPPGSLLTVEGDGQQQLETWFSFSGEQSLSFAESREAVAAYGKELDRAILSRFASDFPLGFELSGGIDSSTIVCWAAHHLPEERQQQMQAFSHVHCEQEPGGIHTVSRHCGLRATHVMPVDPWNPAAALRAVTILGSPVSHGSAISSEPFYRLAEQQGIRTLFSGHGGDELSPVQPASF